MKLFLDFFPIVLFFAAFKFSDIYTATIVAMVAQVATIAYVWFTARKVEPMQWVSLAIILVMGGLTILAHDDTFIKWKPTVLYWVMAAVLLVGQVILRKNVLKSVMGSQLELPEPAWRAMGWSWIVFFAFMGTLNLWVAFHFDTATWVNFKLFGGLGLMAVFVVAQAVWLGRYMKPESDTPEA